MPAKNFASRSLATRAVSFKAHICLTLPGRFQIAAAAAGVPIARYYALVTWATVTALWNYLRRGVPATWEAAEGTR